MQFQSTLRRTERHHQIYNPVKLVLFQSTLRRTERLRYSKNLLCFRQFQSTLRRTERRDLEHYRDVISEISIHAPTNGATVRVSRVASAVANFNPRSDERSDMGTICITWLMWYFNPRSDERSDLRPHPPWRRWCVFQSTLRRTERLS